MTEKVLGVLGGMGPLASAQFMMRLTLLTRASRDQDHIPAVLWSDPRIPDRGAALLGEGPDPLPWLMRGIDGLKAAGCGAIAMPCNTAHGWYDPLAKAAGVPILHIVDAAAADLRRIGVTCGRIGLMGTAATLAMKLYQNRLAASGWEIIEPEPAQMDRLVMPSIAAVKANRVAEAFEPLAEVMNSLASRGAAAVVLGCTEIPIAVQAGPADALRVPVVDTIDALARASINWARPGPSA
ncbi:MAG TPA: aspartate/glutamate racemase family protein [Acetobacteraceae bacterium]|jgi:aspartate racemase|nr:aspartate/glutamate racemase family protein [Acetobacteraceae bacterium]